MTLKTKRYVSHIAWAITLLLGDCDLPDTIQRYNYLDFREESGETLAELLAEGQDETVPIEHTFTA